MNKKEKEELQQIHTALTSALKEVFGEHEQSQRFVDVTRIPLICKSIIDTNIRLENIETKLDRKFVTMDMFSPVRNVVYGLIGAILFSVVGALLMLIIRK
jgi:hypothetical protein